MDNDELSKELKLLIIYLYFKLAVKLFSYAANYKNVSISDNCKGDENYGNDTTGTV